MYNRLIIAPSHADFHIKMRENELQLWETRKQEYINDPDIVALADKNIERVKNSIKEIQMIAEKHNF
jgi:hypothetical protein